MKTLSRIGQFNANISMLFDNYVKILSRMRVSIMQEKYVFIKTYSRTVLKFLKHYREYKQVYYPIRQMKKPLALKLKT